MFRLAPRHLLLCDNDPSEWQIPDDLGSCKREHILHLVFAKAGKSGSVFIVALSESAKLQKCINVILMR